MLFIWHNITTDFTRRLWNHLQSVITHNGDFFRTWWSSWTCRPVGRWVIRLVFANLLSGLTSFSVRPDGLALMLEYFDSYRTDRDRPRPRQWKLTALEVFAFHVPRAFYQQNPETWNSPFRFRRPYSFQSCLSEAQMYPVQTEQGRVDACWSDGPADHPDFPL